MAKAAGKKKEESSGNYLVISRTGTNPLTIAVEKAMDEGFVPIGGVTVSSELRGRERVTTFHQALTRK